MVEGIVIRPGVPEDAQAIAGILRELGWVEHMAAETPEQSERRIAERITAYLNSDSHSLYIAATTDGAVAGYCAVHWLPYLLLAGPEGYVSELFIAASARGRGLGAYLLEQVAAEARRRGCSRLMLINNKVRESYQRSFYAKQGWRERENIANFILEL